MGTVGEGTMKLSAKIAASVGGTEIASYTGAGGGGTLEELQKAYEIADASLDKLYDAYKEAVSVFEKDPSKKNQALLDDATKAAKLADAARDEAKTAFVKAGGKA
jgi:hypothetical protein